MIPAASDPNQIVTQTPPYAESWQRAWRDAITDPHVLLQALGLANDHVHYSAHAQQMFRLRVPRGFLARMRYGDADDPLLRQVLPIAAETQSIEGFLADAVGDSQATIEPGVLRKYHGRALLIATGSCAIHCRYCFRRHFPYADNNAARNRWAAALAAVAADPQIEEVILSGGDPLSLSTDKLHQLTDTLRTIPHVRRLRVHSRLPIVLPERIDAPFIDWLTRLPWPTTVVIHANHANEFDAAVDTALARIRASGIHLLNQAVLLKGINDSIDALANLSTRGFSSGVIPYYIHQLDHVAGAAHFAVSDSKARTLLTALRERLPGYLVPRLVREIPGHASKTPL